MSFPCASNAAAVYELDRRCAEVCTAMSQNGMRFDVERAAAFAQHLKDREAQARSRAESAVNRPLRATKSGGIATKDLHQAFFLDLGAPVLARSELTKKPTLSVGALRAYAACPDQALSSLAIAELERRKARKIRVTYIENVPINPDGRVHPTWNNAGPITGRFSCGDPNLMNLPRGGSDPTYQEDSNGRIVEPWGGVRSLYVPEPGNVIVGYDKSQLELRVAAYTTGCPAYIAAINSGDVHSYNAELVFGDAFRRERAETKRIKASDPKFKGTVLYVKIRTQAKTFIFALNYFAEAETIYAQCLAAGLNNVKLRGIQAVLKKLRRQYHVYYEWQNANFDRIRKTGWVESPILRRGRFVGLDPRPTECANFPIQGGAADIMNTELPQLHDALLRYIPGVKMLAQVHDAVYVECRRSYASQVRTIMEDVCQQPHRFTTSGTEYNVPFPIDISEPAERWS